MISLPKTVTRQRHDCDLNPGHSAPESSTLTTRLPSHPRGRGRNEKGKGEKWKRNWRERSGRKGIALLRLDCHYNESERMRRRLDC